MKSLKKLNGQTSRHCILALLVFLCFAFTENRNIAKTAGSMENQPDEITTSDRYMTVEFHHAGAYIANFYIRFTVAGQRINLEWKNKPVGWKYTYFVPSNATNIEVQAFCATGLFWRPWNEIFKKRINRSMKFTVRGTTLHPSYQQEETVTLRYVD
jgi:hypothetical protein